MAEGKGATPAPSQREQNWKAWCDAADPDMEKPEVVYQFSNGVKKISTDRTTKGIYRRT